ncbi:MAG: malate synthase A [Bacteroidia bacterium]|nr:malate synthase A [Bacteroidia bacterium]
MSTTTSSAEKLVRVNPRCWNNLSEKILTPELLQLIGKLHLEMNQERKSLLESRTSRQEKYDAGELPGFLDENSVAASSSWKVAELPQDLLKRRVEITGPINSAKMVINMLTRNSDGYRADAAMLDFEDSMMPSWENVMNGIDNLIQAAAGTLAFSQTKSDGSVKEYKVDPNDMPLLMVRVRGLHLGESNITVEGEAISGGLLDLTMSVFHTAKTLMAQGKTPKYYIPKCEHYLEARWWNKLFTLLEEALEIPHGTLKATFLIETLPAAFQMEEILYEYRDHAAGLNGGRWDKIFSDIKVLKMHNDRIMADRATIDMQKPWMDNYVKRMIKICHAHGAFAMGGMSAFTPGKTTELREEQTAKVSADKQHESNIGHDGCWVSHPYFIGYAMDAFKQDNQLGVLLEDFKKYPDLLPKGEGPRTLAGLRKNIRVGIAYMQGWQNGLGCVAWDNMMEDLATLEISRAQVWQWMHHSVSLDDGQIVSADLVAKIFDEELDKINVEVKEFGSSNNSDPGDLLKSYRRAKETVSKIFMETELRDFLESSSYLV